MRMARRFVCVLYDRRADCWAGGEDAERSSKNVEGRLVGREKNCTSKVSRFLWR